jgi:hypothetical protein
MLEGFLLFVFACVAIFGMGIWAIVELIHE